MLIFHALEYKLHAEASLLYAIVIHTGEIYSKKINTCQLWDINLFGKKWNGAKLSTNKQVALILAFMTCYINKYILLW